MPVPATSDASLLHPLQYGISRNGPQLADSQQVADLFTSTASSGDSDSDSSAIPNIHDTDSSESTYQPNGGLIYQPVEDTTTSSPEDSVDETRGQHQTLLQRRGQHQNLSDTELLFHPSRVLQEQLRIDGVQVDARGSDSAHSTEIREHSNVQQHSSTFDVVIDMEPELSSSGAETAVESSTEIGYETDSVPSPPRRSPKSFLSSIINQLFFKLLLILPSLYPQANYIGHSQRQKYKVPPQLIGRFQGHRNGKYLMTYAPGETHIGTSHTKPICSALKKLRPDYIPTLGYLNEPYVIIHTWMTRISFTSSTIFLLWFSWLYYRFYRSFDIPSNNAEIFLLYMFVCSVLTKFAVFAHNSYYFLRFWLSLSNRSQVLCCWRNGIDFIVYYPRNSKEAFQRVAFYLETLLVDASKDGMFQRVWDYITEKVRPQNDDPLEFLKLLAETEFIFGEIPASAYRQDLVETLLCC